MCLFGLRLNKRLSKQSEAGELRRHRAHYDVTVMNYLRVVFQRPVCIALCSQLSYTTTFFSIKVNCLSEHQYDNTPLNSLSRSPRHDDCIYYPKMYYGILDSFRIPYLVWCFRSQISWIPLPERDLWKNVWNSQASSKLVGDSPIRK